MLIVEPRGPREASPGLSPEPLRTRLACEQIATPQRFRHRALLARGSLLVPRSRSEVAAGKCWTIDDFPTGRAVGASRLTPREREIASLVAVGMSNKQIARTVNISDGTVKIHLYNAYHKLGVTNRTALATLLHHKVSDEEVAS